MLDVDSPVEPDYCANREVLTKWINYMGSYGQWWLDDIGKDYFSQEYWYLFVITLAYHWKGSPLSVSEACASMKTGSSKTRETRLKKLIAEHLCIKIKRQTDLRRTYLEPTTEMLQEGRNHLLNTLREAIRFVLDARILESRPQPLLDRLARGDEDLDRHLLLPWAEFLIDYTNDWNSTFGNRFHTEEYWYPFVHSLLGCWSGQPLTTTEVCESIRLASSRTREKRVSLAVTRGMLIRQKRKDDLRTTHIVPSGDLEGLLVSHFNRTLAELLSLTRRLLAQTARAAD